MTVAYEDMHRSASLSRLPSAVRKTTVPTALLVTLTTRNVVHNHSPSACPLVDRDVTIDKYFTVILISAEHMNSRWLRQWKAAYNIMGISLMV